MNSVRAYKMIFCCFTSVAYPNADKTGGPVFPVHSVIGYYT